MSTSTISIPSFAYPFKKIKDMDSCFESLAKVDSGNYLFNAKGFWHGGVHFTGGALSDAEGDTKPVCAIADGELVAYRLNPDYTYDKDDTKKEHGYSTGFFLLRHKLAYPADNMLTLFSLYMHTGRFNYLVKTDGAKVRDASAAEKDKLSTGTMLLLDDGTEVEIGGYKRYKILSIFGKNIGSDARYIYTKAVEKLDTGAVVVPPEPMKVHAGDPLGLVGEYNNAPSSNKKVLHLELFTADDVKAFAETAQKKYPTDTSAERPQPTSMIIPSGTVLYRKEEVAAKKVKEGVTHTNLRKAYASGEAGYNTVKEAKTGVILEIDESTLSHDRYKVLKNAGVDVSAQNWTVHKDYIVDSTYDAYTLSETRTNKERNLPIEETKPRVKDMEGKEYFELSSMYVAIEDCTPDHGITFRWVKAFDTASTDNASIFTNFMAHFKKEIGPNELSVNPLYQELFDAIDKSGNDVKGNGKIDYPLEIDKAVKSADVRKLASRYAVKHASEWGDTLQSFWTEMKTHLDGLVSSAETDKERKDRGANAKHMANQTARAKKLKFFPECKGKIKESNTTGAGAFPASDIVYFLHPIRVVGEMGISSCATNWTEGYGREISGQNKYNEWIAEAAQKYNIPCTIFKSLIAQESEFNPKANNQYGYAGLTQVGGPAIAESGLNKGSTTKTNGVYVFDFANDERFDPKKSIFGGAKVLKEKRKRINLYILNGYTIQLTDDEKWRFYLAAYNGGEGVVVQAYKELGQQNAKWEDLVQETAWTDAKFKEVKDKIDKHYKKHNDYVENYNKTHTHKKKKWKVRTDTEWTSIKNTTQYSPLLVSLLYQTWGGKAKYDEVSGYVENIMARKNQ